MCAYSHPGPCTTKPWRPWYRPVYYSSHGIERIRLVALHLVFKSAGLSSLSYLFSRSFSKSYSYTAFFAELYQPCCLCCAQVIMLLHYRPVPAKIPKRRSRAGKSPASFSTSTICSASEFKLTMFFCLTLRLHSLVRLSPLQALEDGHHSLQFYSKEKKKKCNEERPQCDRCQDRGLKCEYEPVKPRKRRRTVSNPEHMGMRPPTTAPGQHLGYHDRLHALRQGSSSGSSVLSGSPTPPLPAIAESWEVHSAHSVFSDSGSSCGSDTILDMHSPLPPFDALDGFARSAAEIHDVKPLQMDPLDGFPKEHYDDDIPTSREMFAPTSALSRSSSYPDPQSAFISPTSGGSPYDFTIPAFSEFTTRESRRGLLDHFCNVLSHLIVFKEDNGNPFRQLVLPMAQKSPPLLSAIYAISSAHLEHRGLQMEERALDLHSKALQGLANLIAHKDEGNRDEVLAVIILLLYYEVRIVVPNKSESEC